MTLNSARENSTRKKCEIVSRLELPCRVTTQQNFHDAVTPPSGKIHSLIKSKKRRRRKQTPISPRFIRAQRGGLHAAKFSSRLREWFEMLDRTYRLSSSLQQKRLRAIDRHIDGGNRDGDRFAIAGAGRLCLATGCAENPRNVDQPYISAQPPGANALSDLNLVPGVNMTNDDPMACPAAAAISAFAASRAPTSPKWSRRAAERCRQLCHLSWRVGRSRDHRQCQCDHRFVRRRQPDSSSLGGSVNINTLTPAEPMAFRQHLRRLLRLLARRRPCQHGHSGPGAPRPGSKPRSRPTKNIPASAMTRSGRSTPSLSGPASRRRLHRHRRLYDRQFADFFLGRRFRLIHHLGHQRPSSLYRPRL